jgi:signal peptidase I
MSESTGSILKTYGTTIAVAVTAALLIRVFVFEAYRIPTLAMHPTLEPGDTIFVSKWPYLHLGGQAVPHRGDVVVFSPLSDPSHDYIKRVLGLPGETVAFHDGHFSVDGKELRQDEATLQDGMRCTYEALPEVHSYLVCSQGAFLENFGPEKIPSDSVFVFGDFRSPLPSPAGASANTKNRSWGIVPLASLKGKALWIWLSIEPRSGLPGKLRLSRMFRSVE